MTKKIVYNPSPLYNLLFRGGWIQIKPLSYYEAEPKDMHYFEHAVRTGQVTLHDSIEEVTSVIAAPVPAPASVEVVSTQPPVASAGLDEAQLKEFLKNKEVVPAGVTTKLGGEEDSVFLDNTPAVEVPAEVPEVPEVVTEVKSESKEEDKDDDGKDDDKDADPESPTPRRGRKAKAK